MTIRNNHGSLELSFDGDTDGASLEVSTGQYLEQEVVDFEAYGYYDHYSRARDYVLVRLPLEEVIALRDYLDAQILRLDKGAD